MKEIPEKIIQENKLYPIQTLVKLIFQRNKLFLKNQVVVNQTS